MSDPGPCEQEVAPAATSSGGGQSPASQSSVSHTSVHPSFPPVPASTPEHFYRAASRAVLLGLLVNAGLATAKLAGGIWGHSFALISDAVNSLGDCVSGIVTLGALWYAQKPADEEHPYGHTRAETVAGSYVALSILFSALLLGWEAIRQFGRDHAIPPAWTLGIAGSNVLIKEALYHYKTSVGRKTGSTAVLANAWDHRSDALCSLAVLIGLASIQWIGPRVIWADELAALVVVAAIAWSAGKLLVQCTSELLDPQADRPFTREIRAAAESVPGVGAVEKLWVRRTGMEYLVDIHIQVNPHMTVELGHEIGHRVKDRLVQHFPAIRDVLVHLEPHMVPDAQAPRSAAPPNR